MRRNAGIGAEHDGHTVCVSFGKGGLDIADTHGRLEVGKQADIIGVPGDPIADISVLEQIGFVMKGGKVYKQD